MYKNLFIIVSFFLSSLSATDFTIASYNCGALPENYDYLRAACMQKLMQERYMKEPRLMSLNEKIQTLALKICFSKNSEEKAEAQHEWDKKGYDATLKQLTSPSEWKEKVDAMITSVWVRPVVLGDREVFQMLMQQLDPILEFRISIDQQHRPWFALKIKDARDERIKRQMAHYLKHDIICLQEVSDDIKALFPESYEMLFSANERSRNGIAWNKERFEYLETVGDVLGRAFVVMLKDRVSNKTLLVASGHLSGCDPYVVRKDKKKGKLDCAKGDHELRSLVDFLESRQADCRVIGMDANVTSLHPRLSILKDYGYRLDYENFLEPTCSNPAYTLNTRIDWIVLKGDNATITNIPVLSIGLNTIQSNASDHKPIAAKIEFSGGYYSESKP